MTSLHSISSVYFALGGLLFFLGVRCGFDAFEGFELDCDSNSTS
ncbi:hypothetical protein PF010_g12868 [Phytophthora fragariae]|uniref:Uncharacterized protein n=1 Tax=Phytophthora fragariae TaxID=53985 RepID=A0A6A3ESM9_9STRA|nr:hypothetical protein PF003_g18957 [Phytophthora fragariae]KAE8935417.1 hypothetical protein PF009_g14637 [Phytophthora fragariae]KAE9105328.1 hypothetical protein PF007_g13739 [Phytophthora fragariae]KAE9105778.1 hypothetical protein PF010_g12868 [Phytophthora fragariae]KAE9142357.1 hypothetical protein PF006_g12525 [Phytophthora fragariae]